MRPRRIASQNQALAHDPARASVSVFLNFAPAPESFRASRLRSFSNSRRNFEVTGGLSAGTQQLGFRAVGGMAFLAADHSQFLARDIRGTAHCVRHRPGGM
jgi:hypothetical protein